MLDAMLKITEYEMIKKKLIPLICYNWLSLMEIGFLFNTSLFFYL